MAKSPGNSLEIVRNRTVMLQRRFRHDASVVNSDRYSPEPFTVWDAQTLSAAVAEDPT